MADWTLVGHICAPGPAFQHGSSAFVDASRRIWGQLAHLLGMTEFIPEGLDRMLTTSELAAYLKVTRQVIYDLRHDGQGPRAVHDGKELRYKASVIDAWLDQRSDPLPKGATDAR